MEKLTIALSHLNFIIRDLRDLKPQTPQDSLQLKNINSGYRLQWPDRDQFSHLANSSTQPYMISQNVSQISFWDDTEHVKHVCPKFKVSSFKSLLY